MTDHPSPRSPRKKMVMTWTWQRTSNHMWSKGKEKHNIEELQSSSWVDLRLTPTRTYSSCCEWALSLRSCSWTTCLPRMPRDVTSGPCRRLPLQGHEASESLMFTHRLWLMARFLGLFMRCTGSSRTMISGPSVNSLRTCALNWCAWLAVLLQSLCIGASSCPGLSLPAPLSLLTTPGKAGEVLRTALDFPCLLDPWSASFLQEFNTEALLTDPVAQQCLACISLDIMCNTFDAERGHSSNARRARTRVDTHTMALHDLGVSELCSSTLVRFWSCDARGDIT